MLTAGTAYGGDVREWRGDVASLGRRIDMILPEDAHDTGPIETDDGRWVIVADCRLDDRADLAAALGIDPRSTSDAALIAAAWATWAEDSLGRLNGDFALIAWDRVRRRVVMARDPLGHRPLVFRRSNDELLAATMPAMLHAAGVRRDPDLDTLSEFAAFAPEANDATVWAGVGRVMPGHVASADANGVLQRRWWHPPTEPLRLRGPGAYREAVRHALDRAIEARLRGVTGTVATHLSGGLDSSTVTASVAKARPDLRVNAFTAVPAYSVPRTNGALFGDEWPAAHALAARYPNIRHGRVPTNHRLPIDTLDHNVASFQRPYHNLANAGWLHAINDAARDDGARVLMTGEFGNLSFSHTGTEWLGEFVARGDWRKLVSAWRAERRHGARRRDLLMRSLAPITPSIARVSWDRMRGRVTVSDIALLSDEKPLGMRAAKHARKWSGPPPWRGLEARLRALTRADPGFYVKGLLAGWGLHHRDPTADRRLIELCLTIPAEEFIADGTPRGLARQTFADRLPATVAGERRKGRQMADWHGVLTANRATLLAEVEAIAEEPDAARVLDVGRMRGMVTRWPRDTGADALSDRYKIGLLRAVSTGAFLRRAKAPNP